MEIATWTWIWLWVSGIWVLQVVCSNLIFSCVEKKVYAKQLLIPIFGLLYSLHLRRKYGYVSGHTYLLDYGCHFSIKTYKFVNRYGEELSRKDVFGNKENDI